MLGLLFFMGKNEIVQDFEIVSNAGGSHDLYIIAKEGNVCHRHYLCSNDNYDQLEKFLVRLYENFDSIYLFPKWIKEGIIMDQNIYLPKI